MCGVVSSNAHIGEPCAQRELGPRRQRRHGDDAQQNRARGPALPPLVRGTRRYGEAFIFTVIKHLKVIHVSQKCICQTCTFYAHAFVFIILAHCSSLEILYLYCMTLECY